MGNAREKMNKAFFLGLHSLFLSLKQRHQTIFNYSGNFVFSPFDYRLAYGGRGKVQRPCKTGSASVYKNLAQPVNKVPIVDLVLKYGLRSIPQDNDAVQCSGRIYSGFSRHGGRLTFPDPFFSFMSLMLLLKAGWLFICGALIPGLNLESSFTRFTRASQMEPSLSISCSCSQSTSFRSLMVYF